MPRYLASSMAYKPFSPIHLLQASALLPDKFDGPPPRMADVLLDFLGQGLPGQGSGGAIERAADADCVVIDLDSTSATTPEQASAC